MIWAIVAGMAVAALVLLVPPLLRPGAAENRRALFDAEVYRDQIAEVGRDLDRGLIDESEADDARAEIGRRLLAADRRIATEDGTTSSARRATVTACVLGAAVPLAALALYAFVGSPDLTGPARRAPVTVAGHETAGMAGINQMITKLGERLRGRPDDARGWALYAKSLARIGQFKEAVAAFRRATELNPRDVDLHSGYAEAQINASGGTVTEAARATLKATLELDPRDARARYFLGLAEAQAGRRDEAVRMWRALEAESPADAPWRPALRRRIEMLAKELGIEAPEALPTGPVSAPGVAPSPVGGPQEKMIRSMVARLASRLKDEPDDVDGWQRLVRSYQVLGESQKMRDALAQLARLQPDDLSVLSQYAMALGSDRRPGKPLPPELERVAQEILKRSPENWTGLWYAGLARREAGDDAAALAHWRRLRELTTPEMPIYDKVVKGIAGIEGKSTP